MKVVWTQRARRNLRAIHDYIADDSPKSATSMVDRITSKSEGLARFPLSGHQVPEFEEDPGDFVLRQVLEGNYRIIYRILPDRLEVLAVIHGARQLPPRESLE